MADGNAGLLANEEAGSSDTTTLFTVIDRDKVFGLNLTVPEDAKELIKAWDDRESVDRWVDSGVDDQVGIRTCVVFIAFFFDLGTIILYGHSLLYMSLSRKVLKYGA